MNRRNCPHYLLRDVNLGQTAGHGHSHDVVADRHAIRGIENITQLLAIRIRMVCDRDGERRRIFPTIGETYHDITTSEGVEMLAGISLGLREGRHLVALVLGRERGDELV